MKFALTTDHWQFFRDHQVLFFEELFFPEQQKTLKASVHDVLAHRLGEKWNRQDPDELFVEGYDLHTGSEALKRLLSQRRLGAVFAELLECAPIRLGPDQYFPCNPVRAVPGNYSYDAFLNQDITLREVSSVQGLKAGLLLCLEPPSMEDPDGFFPQLPGQAALIHPDREFSFSFLNGLSRGSYLLATYTEELALYVRNERDPHMHALKRWGYMFGDKLREPYHPIMFRK